jgi:hypothetical protein
MQQDEVKCELLQKAPEWLSIKDLKANLPNVRMGNLYVYLWKLVKNEPQTFEKKKEGRKAFFRAKAGPTPIILTPSVLTIVKTPSGEPDFVSEAKPVEVASCKAPGQG